MTRREPRLSREYKQLGQGIETTAYRYSRGQRESTGVLKGYDQTSGPGFSKAGFDRTVRDRLAANHAALKQTYGDIVARQRFLTRQGLKTERYKLVQEYIAKAQPAAVLDYTADTLPPEALRQLQRITPIYAAELEKALAGEPAVILDSRNRNNLVVGTDGKLYCLDTGLMNQIQPDTPDSIIWKHRLTPLALMELLSGESIDHILDKPLLAPLLQYLEEEKQFDRQRASTD
ncbi:MAG: hypothetical protein HY565_00380, partial [Candidatus Kerfeldbacteria bacterium]|nr:hypothetical protein [Candidatus Kerfeldbacteria bacterium]